MFAAHVLMRCRLIYRSEGGHNRIKISHFMGSILFNNNSLFSNLVEPWSDNFIYTLNCGRQFIYTLNCGRQKVFWLYANQKVTLQSESCAML